MPDWLNRVLGGRSKKYQKLGPSEENIAGAAASAGKEKEKSMDGGEFPLLLIIFINL